MTKLGEPDPNTLKMMTTRDIFPMLIAGGIYPSWRKILLDIYPNFLLVALRFYPNLRKLDICPN
jgi:hypothetical protein